MDENVAFAWLFRESPTVVTNEDAEEGVLDADRSGIHWRRATVLGLPSRRTRFDRVRYRPSPVREALAPLARSATLLSSPTLDYVWAFFGLATDIRLATEYWTARALGMRVAWRPTNELRAPELPAFLRRASRAYLKTTAPKLRDLAQEAADRWTSETRPVSAWPFDAGDAFSSSGAPVFAQQIIPVVPHGRRLRFPTPPPPVTPQLATVIDGIAVHRVLSPDAADPDGVVLGRDVESRSLVQPGAASGRRVTRNGFAERTNLASPVLIDLPLVHYEDAVAAPLRAAGYAASHSDKGRYHQRTLQLSGGLLFLNWVLTHPLSSRLLDLFFERPQGTPVTYRRAVRFTDLQARAYEVVHPGGGRLRAERRQSAESWLQSWSDDSLRRELLLAGYLLDCSHCSARLWYRSDLITQTFRCTRCDATSVVPATASRTFRLNEAFFSFRDQGGHVVTLALARLRRAAVYSFLYFPETIVTRRGGSREIDAAALLDGRLALVEAKTNNSVTRSEVEFYCDLARRTSAARLIFATTSTARGDCGADNCPCHGQGHRDHAWDDGSRDRIAQARADLSPRGISVDTWCYTDLVTEAAPPILSSYARRR